MRENVTELIERLRNSCEPGCRCTKQEAADALAQLLMRAEKAEARLTELCEQEPVAWRTFDGEGGYDYRSYADNESYREEFLARNPGPTYRTWVQPLFTNDESIA